MSNGSGVIYLLGEDWNSLRKDMFATQQIALRSADNSVAKTAVAGRREASKLEKQLFDIGEAHLKWDVSAKKYQTRRRSAWDSTLGGYRASNGLRLIGFNFENVAARKTNVSLKRAYSQASVYDLLSNLWENDTKAYQDYSPMFAKAGGRPYAWQKGQVRKGRHWRGDLLDIYAKSAEIGAKKADEIMAKELREVNEK